MQLDENFKKEDKKEEEKNENDQRSKPRTKTKDKNKEQQEMSIESGVPDLENQAKETDQSLEEIEIENKSNSDYKKYKK